MTTKAKFILAAGVSVLVAAVTLPNFTHVRKSKDPFEGNSCINRLRIIGGSKDQWAIEHHKATNDIPAWDDLRPYMSREGAVPACPQSGTYTIGRVDESPRCSIVEHSLDFGYVMVVDESGLPISEANISIRSSDKDIFGSQTGTNGVTSVAPFQASMVDAWSARTNTLIVSKDGFHTETLTNPGSWPVRFTLQKESR